MPVFSPVGWLLKGKKTTKKTNALTDTGETEEDVASKYIGVLYQINKLSLKRKTSDGKPYPALPFWFTVDGQVNSPIITDFKETKVRIKLPKSGGGWTNYLDTGLVVDLLKNGWTHGLSLKNLENSSKQIIYNADKIYANFVTVSGKYVAKHTTGSSSLTEVDFEVDLNPSGTPT